MRLSQDKVHDLADQVVALLRDDPEVKFLANEDAVRVAVGSAILDNLQEEAEIEAEADALLAQHDREIEAGDLDRVQLRNKFKHEIARQRGFVM